MPTEKILQECKDKTNIFIFVSTEKEANTKEAIKKLLEEGKNVIVPISCTKDNCIKLSKINSMDELYPSTFGVLEPLVTEDFDKSLIEIFFVPGTRFDKKGNRQGHGLGFFDRFLADVKGKKPIIGVCKKEHVIDKMEVNHWDVPVDSLIIK